MFFPAEGQREDRGNIFHGPLYRCIKTKLWSGRKDDPEVRIELNVEPLKWYKSKSGGINRKNEELFNIRKFRNRTVWKYNEVADKIFIITSIFSLVNLVSIRRIVLLAEFPTIFALKIIFNCRNRHGTSEEKKESKMNLRSHFAPPKSAQIATKKTEQINSTLWIWRRIYYSKHEPSSSPVFLDSLLSRRVTLL